MKYLSIRSRRFLSVFTSLLLTLAMLFTGSILIFAGENEKNAFLSAVGEIDAEQNYAVRKEKADAAEEAYHALSAEEKNEADVIAAKTELDTETEALESLAEDAEMFITLVDSVSDAAGIMAEIEKIKEAKDAYFDDESYPGISLAKQNYQTIKAELDQIEEQCLTFIEYVEKAKNDFDEGAGYRTLKKNLSVAEPLYQLVNTEYDRIANMKTTYTSIMNVLLEIEENNEAFLRQVDSLKKSENYSDIVNYLYFCELTLKNVEDEDYDGIEEGKQAMKDAENLIADKAEQATVFVSAVYDVIHAESFAKRVEAMDNAKEEREKTDLTVPEAEAANAELERFETSYSATVTYENAAMDAFLFGLIGDAASRK